MGRGVEPMVALLEGECVEGDEAEEPGGWPCNGEDGMELGGSLWNGEDRHGEDQRDGRQR